MLFDLTNVSGSRVDEVDELQLAGRHWIRTSDLLLFLGGCLGGAIAALAAHMLLGGWLPYLLIPAGGIAAVLLFSRRRSSESEDGRRRIERIIDSHRQIDGLFILPGAAPFRMDTYDMVELHDHPYSD